MSRELFPLFVDLTGRRCVVIGAGPIGEGKIEGLLHCGARITVIAPHVTAKIQAWATASQLTLQRREFIPADLDSAFLTVAATSSPDTNHAIAAEARRRGVLCNVVDDPDYCDFFYPAVVRRGALQIAVSTSGTSPALARNLREKLEAQFGPEYEAWLEEVEKRRRDILATVTDPDQRRAQVEALVAEESFREFRDRR
jgi:precorrin-2 dehydrogenase/sirohydrochlorin ferrochelatase